MPKIKITVVKRAAHMDLLDRHMNTDDFPQASGPCEIMKDGQEFVMDGIFPRRPEGFHCQGAWNDIQRNLASVMYGGDLPWYKQPGTVVASCSDGLRPVSFRIERIDD
jgi:uncharacterized repeat protein (TIGR04076 family)